MKQKVFEVHWATTYSNGKFYLYAKDEVDAQQQFLKSQNLTQADIKEIKEIKEIADE